ncbi:MULTISPECIES: ABC transporter ATP-binding protein [unclassified Arthrobacter]|uniref:ABC transporter ATP-binding protein n=1 Tax=unclassified Arthrobacter TaxID=235627 RepID=UPI001E58EB20|nr:MULTISPECIES: ABC transporter ATP-binding protein [unclassified Arthrobacter]MCC9146504.1 ABC transporter ATP-binding protein [Arthrobacter sp. zg-Y919]MDK1277734.1 ABC transporter ATP-binding protein [Arthrobacter sp. zg.Y919]WIB02310.1 ABC transporter ATP-binding protein [Arthrobacter sp. zg-Y919]
MSSAPLYSDVIPPSAAAPILEVSGLGVDFSVDNKWVMAAEDVSYRVYPGEILAIVGESGSGKSMSSMALLGLLPANGRSTGSAKLHGKELIGATQSTLRKIRGNDIAMIFQEPMTALNPVLTVGEQIKEIIEQHTDASPADAKLRAIELLRMVEIPDPETRYHRYPHQFSGGQRQRAMIATAIANDPILLIADEPTTALDVTVQAEVLELLRKLNKRLNSAILLITHDMGVVADLADNVVVMQNGRIVEAASAAELFGAPQQDYTKSLLDAVPHLGSKVGGVLAAVEVEDDGSLQITDAPRAVLEASDEVVEPTSSLTPALQLEDVAIEYPGRFRQPAFRAVSKVSFTIMPGEVMGLVGESGSGKSTIGRAVTGLLPVAEGSVRIGGTDIAGLSPKKMRPLRRKFAIVFQDPAASLNPRMSIGESIGEPLFLHEKLSKAELDRRVENLLDDVQLPTSFRNRYPHELSGGQRQRVGIARALSLRPSLLVADEPTSALDVSVQARVLALLQDLQQEYGFACLFVSHDLAVVEILASHIAVLNKGRMVEQGSTEQILKYPQDPYTRRLLAAAPVPDPAEQAYRREQRNALLAAGSIE